MNETEIYQCRQTLINLRSELVKLEESSSEETQPDQATLAGLSRRDAMAALKTAEEGIRQRKRQLQKIDGALLRIKSGEFGKCFVCEEELDTLRLFEDSTITRCMSCIEL